jgi:hypothetical protein
MVFQELRSSMKVRAALVILISLFILSLPLFASQYVTYLMLTFFAYAIMVLGLNLFGYTGLLPSAMPLYGRRRLHRRVSPGNFPSRTWRPS